MRKACVTRAVTAAGATHDSSSVAEWALFLHDENDSNTGGPPDNGVGTGAYRWRGGGGETVKLGGAAAAASTPAPLTANFSTSMDKRRWGAVGLRAWPGRRRKGVRGEENR
jgi:hypothetical protein